MSFFTIRMDPGRKEQVHKFQKLYEKVTNRVIKTQASTYDIALELAIKRLEQIIEDKGKLGL